MKIVAFVCTLLFLPIVATHSQAIQVTFDVVVPPSTPKNSKVYIAGNHGSLGNWDPGRIALNHRNDSVWSISRTFPKGFQIEYKITRGSWTAQAMYVGGGLPGNSTLTAEHDTTVVIRPKRWSDAGVEVSGGLVGTVRYHRGMKGKGLRFDRDIIVWLPPSYDRDTTLRYPVLYMHDGQNVFDPRTSFLGYDWHVDEVADSLIRAGAMNEVIIVGIYNSPDRVQEYSDSALGHWYAKFVIERLKPFVDKTYRTLPDAANTATMGSSMGGLISFLFAWWYPNVFSQAGCLSSAFLFSDDKILRDVKEYDGPKKRIRVYMDCGGVGLDSRLKSGMDEMVYLLKEKGYVEGQDFVSYFEPGAEHNERAWSERVWRPLVFMFGKKTNTVR